MNREEAALLLESGSANERLQAARHFQLHGSPDDTLLLRNRYAVERDAWVRRALERALSRDGARVSSKTIEGDFVDVDEFANEVRAQAVEETTGRLVHEVRAVVGDVRLRARSELPDFDSSGTKAALDRLSELLSAIEQLSHAASSPALKEFDLAEFVRELAFAFREEAVVIELAGPDPLSVVCDPALLEMILRNAIRNAIESVQSAGRSESVIVTWDRTDREYWLAVLDLGGGIKAALSSLAQIGTTSKAGHLGLGLATAEQAAISLSGRIELLARDEGGARFEFRWPIPIEDVH